LESEIDKVISNSPNIPVAELSHSEMFISNPEAAKTNQNNSLFLNVLEEPIADQSYSKQSSSTTPNHEKSQTIVLPLIFDHFQKHLLEKQPKIIDENVEMLFLVIVQLKISWNKKN